MRAPIPALALFDRLQDLPLARLLASSRSGPFHHRYQRRATRRQTEDLTSVL
jgi:hypothetical protein